MKTCEKIERKQGDLPKGRYAKMDKREQILVKTRDLRDCGEEEERRCNGNKRKNMGDLYQTRQRQEGGIDRMNRS